MIGLLFQSRHPRTRSYRIIWGSFSWCSRRRRHWSDSMIPFPSAVINDVKVQMNLRRSKLLPPLPRRLSRIKHSKAWDDAELKLQQFALRFQKKEERRRERRSSWNWNAVPFCERAKTFLLTFMRTGQPASYFRVHSSEVSRLRREFIEDECAGWTLINSCSIIYEYYTHRDAASLITTAIYRTCNLTSRARSFTNKITRRPQRNKNLPAPFHGWRNWNGNKLQKAAGQKCPLRLLWS